MADVIETDRNGRTALHLSAIMGDVEPARKLLERGADINMR